MVCVENEHVVFMNDDNTSNKYQLLKIHDIPHRGRVLELSRRISRVFENLILFLCSCVNGCLSVFIMVWRFSCVSP